MRRRTAFRWMCLGVMVVLASACPKMPPPNVPRTEARTPEGVPPPIERPEPPGKQGDVPEVPPAVKP